MKAQCEVGWFWEFGWGLRWSPTSHWTLILRMVPPSWSLVVTHIFKATNGMGIFLEENKNEGGFHLDSYLYDLYGFHGLVICIMVFITCK
jgi:hypothetical protein